MEIMDTVAQHHLSRRAVLRGGLAIAGAGALGLALGRAIDAQDSTPGAAELSRLGLSGITITADDAGYQGIPASISAGRYLVTLTNTVTAQTTDSTVAAFMLLPDGVTYDQLVTMSSGSSEATPNASPAADSGGDEPPSWFYTTKLAGGPSAIPGQTTTAVVDLTAGNWVVWGEDPTAPIKPVALTVTGDTPTNVPTPTADVMIDEVKTADGYMFQVNGTLKLGQQLIQINNKSDQPHFMLLVGSPVPLNMDQVQMLLSLPDGATPEPSSGLPDPAKLKTGVYAGTQSQGTTQWVQADLDMNTYVLLCFISDPTKGGEPHAFEGMAQILTVGGVSTPTS